MGPSTTQRALGIQVTEGCLALTLLARQRHYLSQRVLEIEDGDMMNVETEEGGIGNEGDFTSLNALLFVVALLPSNTPVLARISLPVHTVRNHLIRPFPLRSSVLRNSTTGPVFASPCGPLTGTSNQHMPSYLSDKCPIEFEVEVCNIAEEHENGGRKGNLTAPQLPQATTPYQTPHP
jgi:hypothetical protein